MKYSEIPMKAQKSLALIAHDNKKEELPGPLEPYLMTLMSKHSFVLLLFGTSLLLVIGLRQTSSSLHLLCTGSTSALSPSTQATVSASR